MEKYYLMNMYNMDISVGSYKFRLEIVILIIVVAWILLGHMFCSCCSMTMKDGFAMLKGGMTSLTESTTSSLSEGFVGANNVAYGPEFGGAKSPDYIMNPSTWSTPNLLYSPGTRPDAGVQAIWNRPKQPIPLPKGELDMFATTEFKPECCPNAYSSSTGCACMTTEQYTYLIERGGNNVPYSQY
jgi:hypothetical protein